MKVNSVNNNNYAACQNRPQNFGAVRLTGGNHQNLLVGANDCLHGSVRYMIDRFHKTEQISEATRENLIGLLNGDEMVLNAGEIFAVKKCVKRGAQALIAKIQHLLERANPLTTEEVHIGVTNKAKELLSGFSQESPLSGAEKLRAITPQLREHRRLLIEAADITQIESDFRSAVPTIPGMPTLEVREAV